MGLDMYLSRKTYVKRWNHEKPEDKHDVVVKRGGMVREDIKPERISHVIEEVAYWRKANAIHKWFVDNVQGGRDECQESYVDIEQLKELVAACKRVLNTVETVDGELSNGTTYYPDGSVVEHKVPGQVIAQKSIAETTLPTSSGFFFGDTSYDEYYLQDLRHTVEAIEPLLDDHKGDYYYQASW